MIQDFWQSSEAVGLSQVSKMLRQLTGQISAHYPSSKIRKTHLRLFRPHQGPHTVNGSWASFCLDFWKQTSAWRRLQWPDCLAYMVNWKKDVLGWIRRWICSCLDVLTAARFSQSNGERLVMNRKGPWKGYRRQAKRLPDHFCVVFLAKKSFSWHGPMFGLFKSWKRSILVAYCCKHCKL